LLLQINQQTGGVMRTLIVLSAVTVLVTLTVALTAVVTLTVAGPIKSCTAVAPTTAPGHAAAISPEEIQRQTNLNGLPVTVIDQPY
jgi:hypothetical protein